MKTAITVVETKRPVSGTRIGYRIKVAHWNLARFNVVFQQYEPSFAKKYLITESGDYVGPPSDSEISRFTATLRADHKASLVWV